MSRRRLSGEAERVNPVIPMHVWRSPESAEVEIVIATHMGVYTIMHEHCQAALPSETGGFLLGTVGFDAWLNCWHLEIDTAVALDPIDQNSTHFTFTFRDVDQIRSYREQEGKALVGWFHSHPDLGIFLSETDLEKTHRVLFSDPFQVALVYDPVRGRAGYFYWDGPQTIDADERDWREFEIAVLGETTAERSGGIDPDSAVETDPGVPEIETTNAEPEPQPSDESEPAAASQDLAEPIGDKTPATPLRGPAAGEQTDPGSHPSPVPVIADDRDMALFGHGVSWVGVAVLIATAALLIVAGALLGKLL